jgi:hypothetical protein
MSDFKEALRQKLRFQTNRGLLSTEQLWELDLPELDELAVKLETEYKDSGKKSFLVKKSEKDKTTKLRFDIVVDILTTKVEENEVLKNAKSVKEHNEKILAEIARRKEEKITTVSDEELLKMLKK